MQSPGQNEPRSINELPKPTEKEKTPQRSVQKKYGKNGQPEDEGVDDISQASGRLPITTKNTDFKGMDYRLDAFNDQ